MDDENKQVMVVDEPDLYDNVVDGVAQFAGIVACMMTRYATTRIVPQNDTVMKRVLRESGSIALSSVAMGLTQQGVKAIGAYLKPFVVRK